MKRSFSSITLFGFLAGISIFCFAVFSHGAKISTFFDPRGFLLVVGGAMASGMISFNGRSVIKALKSIFTNLFPYQVTPQELTREIMAMIEWSRLLQKEGRLGFEAKFRSAEIKDPFIRFGLQLISANYPKAELKVLLQNFIDTIFEREVVQVSVLQSLAGYSPAYGMVGTLVGMVIMMGHMGSDVSAIGPGLSVALLATLYGLLWAQMVFKPSAEKVLQTQEIMKYRHHLLMECFLLINDGESAFKIQDHVNSFLDPKLHIDLVKNKGHDS